jgi:hypothetical protein
VLDLKEIAQIKLVISVRERYRDVRKRAGELVVAVCSWELATRKDNIHTLKFKVLLIL